MFDVNKTDVISGEGLATKIIVDEEERSWSICSFPFLSRSFRRLF